jgi:HEPN/Toprim N-terminal domain 1
MGSFITLGIERLEVDWAKNSIARNHSRLFLPNDLKNVTYYYADEVTEQKRGYARSLRSVLKRLELLGYTVEGYREIYNDLATHPALDERPTVSFEILQKSLSRVDVKKFALPDSDPVDFDLGDYVTKTILEDPEWAKCAPEAASYQFLDGCFLENLDPYIVLRLLAENPANLDLEVAWRFSDLAEGGWIEEERLYEPLSVSEKFLLVTEGSTDTNVLKKSLALVEPDVADFFSFVDMAENYPFTGTGNVVRFCEGLCKINILNRVLVILDNDVAGHEAAQRLRKLKLPAQIRTMVLPDLEKCNRFRTIGPSGEAFENVNGRAASIEFFLDLEYGSVPEPTVRWTCYNLAQDKYQGELVMKENYIDSFFDKAGTSQDYDISHLAFLWQGILSHCRGKWD